MSEQDNLFISLARVLNCKNKKYACNIQSVI